MAERTSLRRATADTTLHEVRPLDPQRISSAATRPVNPTKSQIRVNPRGEMKARETCTYHKSLFLWVLWKARCGLARL